MLMRSRSLAQLPAVFPLLVVLLALLVLKEAHAVSLAELADNQVQLLPELLLNFAQRLGIFEAVDAQLLPLGLIFCLLLQPRPCGEISSSGLDPTLELLFVLGSGRLLLRRAFL